MIKLSQVKGNTWVAEAMELIPLYLLPDRRCILLDTGLGEEREELEAALLDHGLTPAGILCSHAHVDHCANNGYFQKKYHIPVALTAPEAGMCSNALTLKCYFLTLSPGTVEREAAAMVHTPDVLIPSRDGPFHLAGAAFHIVHTPGHSAGHISTITPDNVCYTADALLSRDYLNSKLPYHLSMEQALASHHKLRGLNCHSYIMAHRGVCPAGEIAALIDGNLTLIETRTQEVLSLITRPMTISQIDAAVCAHYQLFTHKPSRALRFERNIRFFVEYLVDQGRLELHSRRGVTCYCRPTGPDHV